MRWTLKLLVLGFVVLSSAGLAGCIVMPDDGYHHHHRNYDGYRGGYRDRDWR